MKPLLAAVLATLCTLRPVAEFEPPAALANIAGTNLVISQVYGGAGCGTVGCSTYKNDYVELFNPTTSAVA